MRGSSPTSHPTSGGTCRHLPMIYSSPWCRRAVQRMRRACATSAASRRSSRRAEPTQLGTWTRPVWRLTRLWGSAQRSAGSSCRLGIWRCATRRAQASHACRCPTTFPVGTTMSASWANKWTWNRAMLRPRRRSSSASRPWRLPASFSRSCGRRRRQPRRARRPGRGSPGFFPWATLGRPSPVKQSLPITSSSATSSWRIGLPYGSTPG
mmetsp:Transcript_44871/g.112834  ORF Transcript_44871/g.112834 Transcript_44871/m.112834 type:complete len:209 (-) Transcript_44871:280-906(-)